MESREYEMEVKSLQIEPSYVRPQRDVKTITGIVLIVASYLFCWPLIALLGLVSAYLERPIVITVGGPAVYAFSYVLLFAGIYLAGKKYAKRVFDWLTNLALRFVMVG